ncbi:MAG: hypothetical protein ACOC2N_08470 [Spirochaetota bacterium]
MDTLSPKVQPATMEEIEEYADEIGETRSAATRELIHRGLRAEREERDDTESRVDTVTTALLLIGVALILGTGELTGDLFGVGFAEIGLALTGLAITFAVIGNDRLTTVYRRVSRIRP